MSEMPSVPPPVAEKPQTQENSAETILETKLREAEALMRERNEAISGRETPGTPAYRRFELLTFKLDSKLDELKRLGKTEYDLREFYQSLQFPK